MMLHTHTKPISMISVLPFMVPEIYPGQDLKGQGHYVKVRGQIKVTP